MELSEGETAVVDTFGKCMDTAGLEQIGLQPWLQLIQSINGWRLGDLPFPILPSYFFEDLMLQAYSYATFPIFWLGVDVNYGDSKKYILTIEEQVPTFLFAMLYRTQETELRAEDFLAGRIHPEMQYLFEMGMQMAGYSGADIKDDIVRLSFSRAIELEWRLVRISTVHEGKGMDHEKYNVSTVRELARIVPGFDWLYFLSKLLGYQVEHDQPIAIKAGIRWLEKLSLILDQYTQTAEGLKALEDYIKWRILTVTLSYAEIPRSVPAPNLGFQIVRALYVPSGNLREEFCIARLSGHFPLSTAALFRKLDPIAADKNKALLFRLFEDVRTSYGQIIQNSAVLDPPTRRHVLQKLGNVTFFGAFPDQVHDVGALNFEADQFYGEPERKDDFFWTMVMASARKYRRDLGRLSKGVSRSHWLDNTNSLTLNAIHNYERNVVVYPMALVTRNFADHSKPGFSNYAGAAFFIGHEIAHAFDVQGRWYGTTGSLGKYWTQESMKKYTESGECFVQQYGEMKGGQEADIANSRQTLTENMADNLGLQAAWMAFERSNELKGELVPGLGVSVSQAFWIGYAQNWCSVLDPATLNAHEKERLRVLGPLRNQPDFARSFGCPIREDANECHVF
ncbi:unnamed protein product, partial [Mesorhabditis spiculigera]